MYDYYLPTTEITFDGDSVLAESRRCIKVHVIDSSDVEPDERFTVQLTSPLEGSGVLDLHPKSASVLIIDDDGTSIHSLCIYIYIIIHTLYSSDIELMV